MISLNEHQERLRAATWERNVGIWRRRRDGETLARIARSLKISNARAFQIFWKMQKYFDSHGDVL